MFDLLCCVFCTSKEPGAVQQSPTQVRSLLELPPETICPIFRYMFAPPPWWSSDYTSGNRVIDKSFARASNVCKSFRVCVQACEEEALRKADAELIKVAQSKPGVLLAEFEGTNPRDFAVQWYVCYKLKALAVGKIRQIWSKTPRLDPLLTGVSFDSMMLEDKPLVSIQEKWPESYEAILTVSDNMHKIWSVAREQDKLSAVRILMDLAESPEGYEKTLEVWQDKIDEECWPPGEPQIHNVVYFTNSGLRGLKAWQEWVKLGGRDNEAVHKPRH